VAIRLTHFHGTRLLLFLSGDRLPCVPFACCRRWVVVNITEIIANAVAIDFKLFLRDFSRNWKYLLVVLLLSNVAVPLSAGAFYFIEHPVARAGPWSFGQVLYYTLQSMFAGSLQFNYDPLTIGGKVIVVVNTLVGLTLFGVFIAVVTMSFQEGSTDDDMTPSKAVDLSERVGSRLDQMRNQLVDLESKGDDAMERTVVIEKLAVSLAELISARKAFAGAELELRRIEKQAWSELGQTAGLTIGVQVSASS
jgi:hypothetical protein